MKFTMFLAASVLCLSSALASAAQERIFGVPFNCANAIRYELIRKWAAENKDDPEGVKEYREYIRSAPAYGCRERANPNVEQVSWCDGSGCSGATATLTSNGCKVSDAWTGQDDGDAIDWSAHNRNCLTQRDF